MERTKQKLRAGLKAYVEQITKKSLGSMYNCPLCGSGTKEKGTGAFSIKDGETWKCFSCNQGGDIFDLIGQVEGITDYQEQFKRAGRVLGVEYQNQSKSEQYTDKRIHITDYTPYYIKANKDISKTDYHRGLSLETLNRYQVGYVKNWRHPKAPSSPTSPRLIIPTSTGSYLARDTREEIPESQEQYRISKVGKVHLFNAKALQEATKPIFVVEGEIDALSIIEVGGEAVGLGAVAMARRFIDLLENQAPVQPIILALDNDEAGQRADREIAEALDRLNILYYRLNPAEGYKDANEALQYDREALASAVAKAGQVVQEAEKARIEAYRQTSAGAHLNAFVDGIHDSVNTPYIPTGFSKLDDVLEGGLYEGLYIFGAISSLGKTTLITQIADQIAQGKNNDQKHDVLIFSLEMARSELMAKSISRHTLQLVIAEKGDRRNAKTTRGITTGKRWERYSKEEKELIYRAVIEYSEYADNIYISEGIGDIGADQIRQAVERHIAITGNHPVVIIDYLQILAPHSERATDKQNTDKAVLELKRISRDYKIPVIGISSFNRASYRGAVTMEAFKESGAIEYSSDILIGLQLKGAESKDFNDTEAKQKDPREVELKILKNRNGRTGDTIDFNYYPLFNYFTEG